MANNTITFEQYLNQNTPIKDPIVQLDEGDFIYGSSYKNLSTRKRETFIYINIKGNFIEYLIYEDSSIVFTTDSDGNAKSTSVFRIKNPMLRLKPDNRT